MTRSISFSVFGLPAAQGSKRHVGGGVMIESSKAVAPWRQDVVAAALAAIAADHMFEVFTSPVQVNAWFTFARPKSHYGTGKNANVVKESAPEYVGKAPDLDKILRSTWDALSIAGIWRDDALCARVLAGKTFGATPGAHLTIKELLP